MIVFKESLRKGTRLNLGAREEGRNHRRRRMDEEEDRCLLRANFGVYCGVLFPPGPPKSELELSTGVGFTAGLAVQFVYFAKRSLMLSLSLVICLTWLY